MTDEALGRVWCERNGKRPDYTEHYPAYTQWRWVYGDGPTFALPIPIYNSLRGLVEPSAVRFPTESRAYAAVGAALRKLKRRADEIAAVLDGVPT